MIFISAKPAFPKTTESELFEPERKLHFTGVTENTADFVISFYQVMYRIKNEAQYKSLYLLKGENLRKFFNQPTYSDVPI